MNALRVQQQNDTLQAFSQRKLNSKDWNDRMPSKALITLLRSIINDHFITKKIYLFNLTITEQKLILSHIVNADDYEYFCKNLSRLCTAICEYKELIQKLLDDQHEILNNLNKINKGGF